MGAGVAPQCSRNRCLPRAHGLILPSWPPRWSRSSELEEGPGHGPDPRFLCPSGPARPDFGQRNSAARTISWRGGLLMIPSRWHTPGSPSCCRRFRRTSCSNCFNISPNGMGSRLSWRGSRAGKTHPYLGVASGRSPRGSLIEDRVRRGNPATLTGTPSRSAEKFPKS
jgi:hypothetical protein